VSGRADGGGGVVEVEDGHWLVTDPSATERLLACPAAQPPRADLETPVVSWGPDGREKWLATRRAMRPVLNGPGAEGAVPAVTAWRGVVDPVRESVRLVSGAVLTHLLGEPEPELAELVERELSLAATGRSRRRLLRAQRATYEALRRHAARGSGPLPAALDGHGLDEHARTLALRTMVLSGYHVPAAALAWTLVETAAHEDVQRRIRAEAGEARTRLCEAVVRESLRLHPPIRQVHRVLEAPTEGFPEGTRLLFSPFLNQRDPAVYPDPEAFRPDRWLGGPRPAPGNWFPFALGPRVCPGSHLAMTTLTTALATVLDTCTLTPHRAPDGPADAVPDFPRGALLRAA
jgi:cytochrome P450